MQKNFDLNKKLTTLPTKAELKAVQDKIVQLQAFDSSSFHGKKKFLVIVVFKLCLFIHQHLITVMKRQGH